MSRFHRHKFWAKPTQRGGIKFPSQLEGRYFDHLEIQRAAGNVLFFHRQVKFDLGGGTTYSVDFQVFYADGRIRYIDTKGAITKDFIKAKKQAEALYPVTIEVVGRGDF